ncbi:hypothetical protein NQ315_004925 [Exocentrus adspersus]|uniref:Uncharacterized protein n=1 Tax=Exocentrus adspersus TaxID=1586481 RepID=A0AAV8W2N7_9CUCU|nr:hypothetical protein NQ315_004925 [Exocentrus adspersus]
MSSSEKEVAAKMYTDKNLFAAQVFQCIAYITHKCPLLQELFLKWTNLGIREKVLLNYIAFHIVEKGQIELYTAIIQGFGYWNTLQDTEGS